VPRGPPTRHFAPASPPSTGRTRRLEACRATPAKEAISRRQTAGTGGNDQSLPPARCRGRARRAMRSFFLKLASARSAAPRRTQRRQPDATAPWRRNGGLAREHENQDRLPSDCRSRAGICRSFPPNRPSVHIRYHRAVFPRTSPPDLGVNIRSASSISRRPAFHRIPSLASTHVHRRSSAVGTTAIEKDSAHGGDRPHKPPRKQGRKNEP